MGSREANKEHLTILVTGFEAFQALYPVNPSYEIAKALPDIITSANGRARPVKVILHIPAVKVVYEHVLELVPKLLAAYENEIDMLLHIGMASGRPGYCVERYAHRDGYSNHKDLDDRVVHDEYMSEHFHDCPAKMTTSFDYLRLWEDWWLHAAEMQGDTAVLTRDDLCQSENAGHYLCDFIYFNSLAYYARHNKSVSPGRAADRPVLFYHVPGASDESSIARGTIAAIALIMAMADQIDECKI